MKWSDKISKIDIIKKIKASLSSLSTKFIYSLLLLFYAYKNDGTPVWAKNIILGAIAYFISPIDSIPDLTPFIGFTDDFGVISFGLVTIACYIDDGVRSQALESTNLIVGNPINPEDIKEVDLWL